VPVPRRLPVAVVNYPNDEKYTRVIEHSQFTGVRLPATTVTFEHPVAYEPDRNEPYYPVPTAENRARYSRYVASAAELDGRVLFVGRLARYRYYDMDKAVNRALQTFRHEIVDRLCEDAPALSA
jgi:UDP-galactopyranose mutase